MFRAHFEQEPVVVHRTFLLRIVRPAGGWRMATTVITHLSILSSFLKTTLILLLHPKSDSS